MRRMTCRLLCLAVLTSGPAFAQDVDRFRLETFTVDVTASNRSGVSTRTEQATFLLDSARGNVWRCTADGLATILFNPNDTPQQHAALKTRLQALVIPEIHFRNATLSNVVSVLQDQAREFDDPAPLHPVAPIQMTIAGTVTNAGPATADQGTADRFADPLPSSSGASTLSFDCRFVSLWDVLKISTEVMNVSFRLQGDHEIVFEPLRSVKAKTSCIRFALKPGIQPDEDRVLAFLKALDCKPEECSVHAGLIEATGTRQQLDAFEFVLETSGLVVPASDRFVLTGRSTAGRRAVVLSEPAARRAWRYQAANGDNGIRIECFLGQSVAAEAGGTRHAATPPATDNAADTFRTISGFFGYSSGGKATQFKLDTQLGRVWRVDGEQPMPVHVEGRGPEWLNVVQETKAMRAYLEKIIIPEVTFRQATISDAMRFFEGIAEEYSKRNTKDTLGFRRSERAIDWIRMSPLPSSAASTVVDPFAAVDDGTAWSSEKKLITYQAQNVMLWNALKTTAELAGCEVAVREWVVLVKPPGWEPGTAIAHAYRICPSQTVPLGRKTAADDLARMGFVASSSGSIVYSPELQTIVLSDVPLKHDAFLDLLRAKGIAPTGPGLWRLVNGSADGCGSLFLLNSITGEVWAYRETTGRNGSAACEFIVLQPGTAEECGPPAVPSGPTQ